MGEFETTNSIKKINLALFTLSTSGTSLGFVLSFALSSDSALIIFSLDIMCVS